MSFYVNGFLGEQIDEVIAANYKKYNELFRFCEDLNRYLIEITRKIKLEEKDDRGAVICCLLIKILNACQGIVIMSKYGLDIEAQTIGRTALESLFYLSAIVLNEAFYNDFIKSDKLEMQKLYKKIKKNPSSFQGVNLSDIKNIDENEKLNEYKVLQVAEKAEMVSDYYNAYIYLCSIAHPDLINLRERYMIEDCDSIKFNFEASTKDIELTLYLNCFIICRTLSQLDSYFKISIEDALKKYEAKFLEIFKGE